MPELPEIGWNTVSQTIKEPALENLFLFQLTNIPPSRTSVDSLSEDEITLGQNNLVQAHTEQIGIELLNLSPDELRHSVLRSPFIQDVETNTVSISLVEDREFSVLRFLRNWNRRIWNNNPKDTSLRGTVNPPREYQFDGRLLLIDDRDDTLEPEEVSIRVGIELIKMVPTNVPELQMNYTGGDNLIHNVDFQIEDFVITTD